MDELVYSQQYRQVPPCFYFDEAWIHLDGNIDLQNFQVRVSENPNAFVEKCLHLQKIGVWYAISRKQVVGYFFFQQQCGLLPVHN